MARPIGLLQQVYCASPGYVQRHGLPRSPADWPQHQGIRYAPSSTRQSLPWEWLEDGQVRHLALPGSVTVNHVETYIACALAGLGLIQLPAFDVQALLASGALVLVLPDHPPPPMTLQWVYPHRRHLPARVQTFITWATAILQPHCQPAPARDSQGGSA